MNVSLVMVKEDGNSREFTIDRLPTIIGREEGCKLRVPLASVSRKHCELLEDDDELAVRDLGSSNGTYVNGERVKQRELVPGDLIAIGPVVFVVRIDGHPKDIDPIESYAAGAVALSEPGGKDGGDAPGEKPTKSVDSPKAEPARKKKDRSSDSSDISDLLADLELGDDDD